MKNEKIVKISKKTFEKIVKHAVFGDSMNTVIERIVDNLNNYVGKSDKLLKPSKLSKPIKKVKK
jgi:hypothetical protein